MEDIFEKVKKLSEFLDDEAIAQALKITPEAVQDIRKGKADIRKLENPENNNSASPVIQVNSVKTAYRQKIISVCRAKGGVGCTVTALGLAYLLSNEIKVLLIDFNFTDGGSDLNYYLNLPDYPHMGLLKDNLEACTNEVKENFYALQPPKKITKERDLVEKIINLAKQDFDAVVIDLPNSTDDLVVKTIRHSNTIVAVTESMDVELVRLAMFISRFNRKDIILAANKFDLPPEAKNIFQNIKTVKIEEDKTLLQTFERCDLPRKKSVFMKGIKQIKDGIFDKQEKSILKKLFGG